MKLSLLALLMIGIAFSAEAQRRTVSTRPAPARTAKAAAPRTPEIGQQGVVIDETLSVLRESPSLFSPIVHRIGRGKKVQILGVAEGDGW